MECSSTDDVSDECADTWLTTAHDGWQNGGGRSIFSSYVFALHASMSILVHPHTYNPTGPGETMVFSAMLLLGGFIWTQVISRSTALFTSLDGHNIHYQQTMDDLNSLSAHLGLSQSIQKRLRKFFIRTKGSWEQNVWSSLTKKMSPQLRRDACREMNSFWLLRIR